MHLFEEYPLLKERIAHVRLGEFPTPIRHLRHLGEEIGTDSLYLKPDGLSGQTYGGNKVRKEVILFWNTYNARDFSHAIKGIDYHQLPACFHRYFDEDMQPLDKRSPKTGDGDANAKDMQVTDVNV